MTKALKEIFERHSDYYFSRSQNMMTQEQFKAAVIKIIQILDSEPDSLIIDIGIGNDTTT